MTSLPLLSAPSSPSSSAVSGVNVVTVDVSLEFFSVVVFKMRSARLHRPRLLLWVYVSEPDLSRHNQETKGNDSDEPGHTEVPSRWQTDGSVHCVDGVIMCFKTGSDRNSVKSFSHSNTQTASLLPVCSRDPDAQLSSVYGEVRLYGRRWSGPNPSLVLKLSQ